VALGVSAARSVCSAAPLQSSYAEGMLSRMVSRRMRAIIAFGEPRDGLRVVAAGRSWTRALHGGWRFDGNRPSGAGSRATSMSVGCAPALGLRRWSRCSLYRPASGGLVPQCRRTAGWTVSIPACAMLPRSASVP
jgi:hypothetical protein